MKKILVPLLFAAALTRAEPHHPSTIQLTPGFINQLAQELRTNHPALAAVAARTNAAAHAVTAVRVWEDPMLTGGYLVAENSHRMRMEEGDVLYGVEQKLPLWGRPQAMRRMARAELDVAVADAELRFQQLRAELARALFRAALTEATLALGEEDLAWLDQQLANAEARHRSGTGSLPEVLRLQNERARRADQLTTTRAQRRQDHAALNRLLNRPLTEVWPRLALPQPADPVPFSEELVQLARAGAPELAKQREDIRAAAAAVDQTRRARHPEVSVGVFSRSDSRTGDWRQSELMVNLSLPWFNRSRYRADLARDEARRQAAELEAANMELALRAELHDLTTKLDAARREALLYREEILPRSEQALAATTAAWQSGTGLFLDVIEARRMVLEARLMSARAVAGQWEVLSELVLCCGLADFDALEMLGIQVEAPQPK